MPVLALTVRCRGVQVLVELPDDARSYSSVEAAIHGALLSASVPGSPPLMSPAAGDGGGGDPAPPRVPCPPWLRPPPQLLFTRSRLAAVAGPVRTPVKLGGAGGAVGTPGVVSPLGGSLLPAFASADGSTRVSLDMYLVLPLGEDVEDGQELVPLTDDLDIGLLRCVRPCVPVPAAAPLSPFPSNPRTHAARRHRNCDLIVVKDVRVGVPSPPLASPSRGSVSDAALCGATFTSVSCQTSDRPAVRTGPSEEDSKANVPDTVPEGKGAPPPVAVPPPLINLVCMRASSGRRRQLR